MPYFSVREPYSIAGEKLDNFMLERLKVISVLLFARPSPGLGIIDRCMRLIKPRGSVAFPNMYSRLPTSGHIRASVNVDLV